MSTPPWGIPGSSSSAANPPNGMTWLTDTISGLDLVDKFGTQTPSIFINPSNSTSLGLSTYNNPYNTLAQINGALQGNLAGKVIGWERGTTLRTLGSFTSSAIHMQMYGTQAKPVWIVPFGDAVALPVITGGYRLGIDGYSFAGAGPTYTFTVAKNVDVWENNGSGTMVRCTKVSGAPTVAGQCQYSGTTLTYYPRYGSGLSYMNSGAIEFAGNLWPILYEAPNVATTGYVNFVGLDIRMGRGNGLFIASNQTSVSNITSMGACCIYGCSVGMIGRDASSYSGDNLGSNASISFNGVQSSIRIGQSTDTFEVMGNYTYDAINNGIELTQVNYMVMQYNIAANVGGNSIIEMYADCSHNTIAYNIGNYSPSWRTGRLDNTTSGGGVWCPGYTSTTPYDAGNTYDNAQTANVGNIVHDNLVINPSINFMAFQGGSGHKVYNNTCFVDHDFIYPSGTLTALPSGFYTDPSVLSGFTTYAANGFCDFSNNIIYWKAAPLAKAQTGYVNPGFISTPALGATKNIPTGNNNIYFMQNGLDTANWIGGQTNFTTYQTAVSTYNLDQNSMVAASYVAGNYGNEGGVLCANGDGSSGFTPIGMDETNYKPLNSSSPIYNGGKDVTSNYTNQPERFVDLIGKVVANTSTPTIGAKEL